MISPAEYNIWIKPSAEREMDSLAPSVFARVSKAILGLKSSPRPRGCKKLRGRQEYRLRVGDYRILYVIDDTAHLIEVVAVGHRKDVYR